METTRWTNPTQPQYLQSSVILLYISAALGVLFGGFGTLALPMAAARVAGGFGCANERRWGYYLAVGIAVLPFVLLLPYLDVVADHLLTFLINFAFDLLLVFFLLHPQTRSYQKIWFR
jgi:hypothetical protein